MNTGMQALPFDRAALQQLCLASLGGDGQKMEPPMKLALDANFGSVQRGVMNLWPWGVHKAAARGGRCWYLRRVPARWSTSGSQIQPRCWQAASPSWRWP